MAPCPALPSASFHPDHLQAGTRVCFLCRIHDASLPLACSTRCSWQSRAPIAAASLSFALGLPCLALKTGSFAVPRWLQGRTRVPLHPCNIPLPPTPASVLLPLLLPLPCGCCSDTTFQQMLDNSQVPAGSPDVEATACGGGNKSGQGATTYTGNKLKFRLPFWLRQRTMGPG